MPSVKRKPRTKTAEPTKKTKLADLSARPSEATQLEDLKWKSVAFPEGLEDAEGFFGLEEVENVKVIRNHQGAVTYQLAKTSDAVTNTQALRGSPSTLEWEGFDDEKVPQVISKHEKAQQKILNPKKTKTKPSLESNPISGAGAFAVLESISNDEVDVSAWSSLGLTSNTLSSLASLGFSQPTPIQLSAIPEVLAGHDVVGKAATGSGKTLAFAIPILEHFLLTNSEMPAKANRESEARRDPLAMILAPTRELAHQISSHLEALFSKAGGNGPRIATITGGLSLQKQQRVLGRSDVLVGTPGRLWDLMQTSSGLLTWLRKVKFLVLDEADRLLSDGHYQEIADILSSLDQGDLDQGQPNQADLMSSSTLSNLEANHPRASASRAGDSIGTSMYHRQTLVFSATFQKDLQQKLAGKGRAWNQNSMEYLLDKLNFRNARPKFINANPMAQMAPTLREGLVECAGLEKDLYLYAVLLHHQNARALVFANSIASVQRLTPFLHNLGMESHALHSHMSQKARLQAVERFSSPSRPNSILVATDVAARGLDIPSVEVVVHYHLPRTADMYVHRSGRTARRSQTGVSIMLCAPSEAQGVRRLVAKVHATHQGIEKGASLRTLALNRQIVARLKDRVALSKTIADTTMAKEKASSEDAWLRTAAMDLGVEVDESVLQARGKGRGHGRLEARKAARSLGKSDVKAMRQQLATLLSQKINAGVSTRYLSAGGIDVDALLQNTGHTDLLGPVEDLGL